MTFSIEVYDIIAEELFKAIDECGKHAPTRRQSRNLGRKLDWFPIVVVGCVLLATFATFSITFIDAYLNQHKSVTIYINRQGEADFELFILVTT
jgi:hypothetical protein